MYIHSPRSEKLHKIFNRNTVKVSYSYMNNMSKIVKENNKKSHQNQVTKHQNAIPEKNRWNGRELSG